MNVIINLTVAGLLSTDHMENYLKNSNVNDIINDNHKRKVTTTYDIKHPERVDARGAWKFANTAGYPLNVHLAFEFLIDPSKPEDDIKVVRGVAHKLRMWLQHKRVPSNMVWTRIVPKGTKHEQVDILVHVPEQHYDNLKKNAEGWGFNIRVKKVTYQEDQLYASNPCTIFDYMFKAASYETRCKEPKAPFQPSEPMKGRRSFCSVKLWVPYRRLHRDANSAVKSQAISLVQDQPRV